MPTDWIQEHSTIPFWQTPRTFDSPNSTNVWFTNYVFFHETVPFNRRNLSILFLDYGRLWKIQRRENAQKSSINVQKYSVEWEILTLKNILILKKITSIFYIRKRRSIYQIHNFSLFNCFTKNINSREHAQSNYCRSLNSNGREQGGSKCDPETFSFEFESRFTTRFLVSAREISSSAVRRTSPLLPAFHKSVRPTSQAYQAHRS